jgi:hypothetical protein
LTDDPQALAVQWLRDIEPIVTDVSSWSADIGWIVHRKEKPEHERALGDYTVPVVEIKTPAGHLIVEPVARAVVGADGRIDLYAWPSLHRMMLIRAGGQWRLKTDSGVYWPKPWSKETFLELAQELTGAA